MDIDINLKNIACLSKTMALCNKQHLATFEAQFIEKLSNTETELKKKALLIKKISVYYKSVNFTAYFVKIHVISNSCNSVTFFASLFY